jgi:hypothetical protein
MVCSVRWDVESPDSDADPFAITMNGDNLTATNISSSRARTPMAELSAEIVTLLNQYAEGPSALRQATAGLNHKQLVTPAPPGNWSVMQIVCHIADFEIVYADRMKRVLVEDRPTMFGGDPDQFAARLIYDQRDLEEELNLIAAVRASTVRILRTASAADFERVGVHSVDGPLTLTTLLKRIAGHIPHHGKFIAEKRPTLLKLQ